MSYQDRYVFLPKLSIEPNKASSFNQMFIKDYDNERLYLPQEKRKNSVIRFKNINETNTIVKKYHGFKISDNAYRTLKRRINWLYYLSKSKQVTTYNGKRIYNFKIGFLTLTLPSKQKTNTQDITNRLFNQFLTELRSRTKMVNYVWRLEFQNNGNVHYHLVTDTYLDYFFVLKIWNRIISKDGYVSDYQNKFKDLSLLEYRKKVDPEYKGDFNLIAKRYAKGKSNNWSQPNTIDLKSVISKTSIASYLSKYFSKGDNGETIKNELDNEENSKGLRLWFCSRALSKLKSVCEFVDAIDFDCNILFDGLEMVRKYAHKYAVCYYFEIKNLPNYLKIFISKLLKDYSIKQGYIPSS